MSRTIGRARTGLVLVLASIVLVLGGVAFARRVGAMAPLADLQWTDSSIGPIVLRVDADGPADRAGLRPGDRLVAVDGRPIAAALDAEAFAWGGDAGATLPLRVERAGRLLDLELRLEWHARSEPYAYLAIVGLAFWVSGLFIALRWPRIRGGLSYTLFAFASCAQLMLSHTGRGDTLDWWVYAGDVVSGALVPALLLQVAVATTKRAPTRRRLVLGPAYGVALLLVLSAAWLSPVVLGGAYRFADPAGALEARDRIEILALGLALLAAAMLLVRSAARSSSAMRRSQMRWMSWGLAVGYGPFVLLYALPWALGAADLPAWAQFLSVVPLLIVPAAFTAALARYRLHDLDVFLLRGVSEVAALFGTFAVLAGAVFLLREGVGPWLSLTRGATRYVAFLIAAVSYPQVRAWVRIAVERVFYRKRYSYRATLLDWARELNAETDLRSLLTRVRERVRETLDVPEARVLIRTDGSRFETLAADGAGERVRLPLEARIVERLEGGAALDLDGPEIEALPWARHLFVMRVKDRLRAVLAVAEREPPAEPLTSEDRALLGTLAAHTATAIEAARLVREVRERADEIERLHAQQAKILEGSAVGLLLVDPEGRIQAWNRALEEIHGLPRETAIGRTLQEVFPLQVARRIEREGRPAAGSQAGSRLFRLTMVNRRGRRIVVNTAISPADAGGRVISIDDVTGWAELEEQMLQQERLASLGLLAAGVAHEINTPLTGISSYAQLLLEQTSDGPRREVLEKIETQTRRASDIANSLLDMASPQRAAFSEIEVNASVEEVLKLFGPQIRARGVQVRVDLATRLPPIRGHRGKLQQVLLNLLLNARDAVARGGDIGVTTSAHGGRVVIAVSDSGPGIPEEDLSRIFDPFFTTKGRGHGTGLGLSISYGIVQEHGGEIRVRSESGTGTCFYVELVPARPARAMA